MKKSLLILLIAALALSPTAAFATFSVIQDSCRTEGNTEQQVNIPAPAVEVEPFVTCLQGRSPGQMWGLGAPQGVTSRPLCCRS
jgi:flagellar basal body-associated protein FliL